MSKAVHWGLAALLAWVSNACDAAEQHDDQNPPVVAIQWLFRASPSEREYLEQRLNDLLAEAPGADNMLDGEVRRFGRDEDEERYLLIRSHRDDADGEKTILLYAIGVAVGETGYSQPFETGIFDFLGSFEPLLVNDLDSDVLPDFTYCGWGPADDAPAMRQSVGFRRGSWYALEAETSGAPDCPPRRIP